MSRGRGDGTIGLRTTMTPVQVLALAAHSLPEGNNWISARDAEMYGIKSSASHVYALAREKAEVDGDDLRRAGEAYLWLMSQPEGNEYLDKVRHIGLNQEVSEADIGLFSSAFAAYERHRVWWPPNNEFVSHPNLNYGDPNVTYMGFRSYDGDYGRSYFYLFRDESGRHLVWKTSLHLDENITIGSKVSIAGKITKHYEGRDGARETRMTRCKVRLLSD